MSHQRWQSMFKDDGVITILQFVKELAEEGKFEIRFSDFQKSK